MNIRTISILLALITFSVSNIIPKDNKLNSIQDILALINSTIVNDPDFKGQSFEKTAYYVDTYGPRMWGGKTLEFVVQDIKAQMEKDNFENIQLEELKEVPVWTRGEESLTLFSPRPYPTNIPMIGLGLSVGGSLIQTEVVMVYDWADLATKDVNGKIAFFNCKYESYGKTVDYRVNGASRAAAEGAVGVIIRSITPTSMESPHTGMLYYRDGVPKIPACAISLEDADMFERMVLRGQKIVVDLKMEAKFEENTVTAHNIIAEIKGSEFPDEIILMGGHIDSWDTGPQTGASDDLAGFFVCYEALRVILKSNLRPKRTIRLIGWSGEEMGGDNNGAQVYVRNRINEMDNHILAFESDLGASDIKGFGFSGSDRARYVIDRIVLNFEVYGMKKLTADGGNADTGPLFEYGVPTLNNYVRDTPNADEYFVIHHSAGDTMSALNPDFMDRNVMGIAGILYSIANLKERLPRNNAN